MVRKARTTIVVSAVVAAVTCGSTLNAARDASPEARANRDSKSQSALVDRTNLTVRVTPLVRLTRGDAYGMVIVPRHADNRVLRVILESEDYYSLSDIPLDGEYAALSYPVSWRDLPPGSYCVTVQVYGPTGMRTSTSIGSTHTLQMDR
jgi:hypothetical protein